MRVRATPFHGNVSPFSVTGIRTTVPLRIENRIIMDKIKAFTLFLLVLLGSWCVPLQGSAAEARDLDSKTGPLLFMEFKDETLKDALSKIMSETGYEISVKEEFENNTFFLDLRGVSFIDGLRRVLGKSGISNYALLISEEHRRIRVYDFPASDVVRKAELTPSRTRVSEPAKTITFSEIDTGDDIPPLLPGKKD